MVMTKIEIFESEGGFGIVISPEDDLSQYEVQLQKLSDSELLAAATNLLRSIGMGEPPMSIASVDTSREGLLDLLVGLYAVSGLEVPPWHRRGS